MKTIIKISLLTCIAIAISTGNGRTFACGQRTLFMTTAIVPYSKTIPLTKGKKAIVGYWWHSWLSIWKWQAKKDRKTYYAKRGLWIPSRHNNITIAMQHYILRPRKNIIIDHIDRNGLNNTEGNLRYATFSQNQANRDSYGKTSNYLGVAWNKEQCKWVSQITCNKKRIIIGYFISEIEAAKAYDAKAKEIHGEFANLNIKQS